MIYTEAHYPNFLVQRLDKQKALGNR